MAPEQRTELTEGRYEAESQRPESKAEQTQCLTWSISKAATGPPVIAGQSKRKQKSGEAVRRQDGTGAKAILAEAALVRGQQREVVTRFRIVFLPDGRGTFFI